MAQLKDRCIFSYIRTTSSKEHSEQIPIPIEDQFVGLNGNLQIGVGPGLLQQISTGLDLFQSYGVLDMNQPYLGCIRNTACLDRCMDRLFLLFQHHWNFHIGWDCGSQRVGIGVFKVELIEGSTGREVQDT